MTIAAFAGLIALGLVQQTDTTFAVRAGGRLELDVHNGSATVRTWDRDVMRVQATHGERIRVRVRPRTAGVEIEAENRGGGPASGVRFQITVPRRYNVTIDGVNVAATVEGLSGSVAVENVEGAITLRDIDGPVEVESVSGSVVLENVRGSVRANSVNQNVRMSGVRGNIEVETANGSIVMQNIDAARVEVSTVNGIVSYDGTVRDGGSYTLHTHNGAITMTVPDGANAAVSVTTHNGRVQSTFAVPVQAGRQRSISFTLGSGSARIDIASFNGSINLIRPRGR